MKPTALPRQHLARPDRRRRPRCSTRCATARSPAPGSTSTTPSRCPPTIRCARAPNTLLTPHLGYVTAGTYERFYGDAVEDIAAFLRGEPCARSRCAHSGRQYSGLRRPRLMSPRRFFASPAGAGSPSSAGSPCAGGGPRARGASRSAKRWSASSRLRSWERVSCADRGHARAEPGGDPRLLASTASRRRRRRTPPRRARPSHWRAGRRARMTGWCVARPPRGEGHAGPELELVGHRE